MGHRFTREKQTRMSGSKRRMYMRGQLRGTATEAPRARRLWHQRTRGQYQASRSRTNAVSTRIRAVSAGLRRQLGKESTLSNCNDNRLVSGGHSVENAWGHRALVPGQNGVSVPDAA
eukprot:3086464-Rhodomonas_salina.1